VRTGLHGFCVDAFKKNKSFQKFVVDSVLFLGRRGLPLRGHRNDSKNHPPAGEYSVNPGAGNFIELLNYAVRRGDAVLKRHYESHAKNASYHLSYQIQNEIINCCGEEITENIISRVREYFSILADEAMDAAKMEQLALVLRYVHNNKIYKDFIGFLHLKDGLSGKHLANCVSSALERFGLKVENIRGQGYDGAGFRN